MNDRSDHDLGFAKVTRKVMSNGEIRTRIKFPNGITMTMTEMPDWKWQDEAPAPVQDGHYHKGLTEVYYVLKGWMLYVGLIASTRDIHVVEQGETVTFHPNMPHMVLLGPEAIIQTTKYGSSVGNPERKGSDWWPCVGYYDSDWFKEGLLSVARGRKNAEIRQVWFSRDHD